MAVLHPKYKLEYFKRMNWEPEWIKTAEAITRKRFQVRYATLNIDDRLSHSNPTLSSSKKHDTSVSDDDVSHFQAMYCFLMDSLAQDFFNDDMGAFPMARAEKDELTHFLAVGIEQVDDPIVWWQRRTREYPRLSRMALDYLTIPGT